MPVAAAPANPFVTLHCPSLSAELLESELFGHVEGAFTGAVRDTFGKVAPREGGTLFLDEIGDLPLALQPKLLRLLQERCYERVGETHTRVSNVRMIAATNRNLETEIVTGRFREDLYYRLNVIEVRLPPLREAHGGYLAVSGAFVTCLCAAKTPSRSRGLPSPRATLCSATFGRGTSVSCANAVERGVILAVGSLVKLVDLPSQVGNPGRRTAPQHWN